jgi:2-phosphoglycerate kinase
VPTTLKVNKRDGGLEIFSLKKLENSILKALDHKGANKKLARIIALEVRERLAKRHKKRPIPSDEIKQVTYKVMVEMNLKPVAKFYLLYRYL